MTHEKAVEFRDSLDSESFFLESKIADIQTTMDELNINTRLLTAECNKYSKGKRLLAEKPQEIQDQINLCSLELDIARSISDEIGRKREDAQRAVLLAEDQMNASSEQYHGEGVDQFRVFTPEYHQALHSSDVEESINAHLCNPWFTDRYNREREKLFYYASILFSLMIKISLSISLHLISNLHHEHITGSVTSNLAYIIAIGVLENNVIVSSK